MVADEIQRLREQEANLRTAQRLLNLGIWKLNLDTNELYWSDHVYAMYGVARSDFANSYAAYIALVHPDDLDAMQANFAAYVAQPESYFEFRHRIRRPDGGIMHVRGVGELASSSEGRILTGVVQDVTADVAARTQLDAATGLLRIAGKSARMGGWRVNLRTGMVEWSDEINHIHEITARQSLSIDEVLNFYAPEHRDRIRQLFIACSQHGEAFDTVLQLITARGNRRWVRTIGEAAHDANGEITWVRGAFQDVTELVEARRQSEELSQRLHQTLDSISDAFILIDPDFSIAFVNQQAERLLRRDRQSLLGRYVWDEFPDAIAAGFREPYEQALRTGSSRHFERFYPSLNCWFRVDAYPGPEGLAVYFRDISAEREREAQLRLLESAVARQNDILVITEANPIDGPDGPRIVYVNDAFTRLTGYTREQAIGKTPRILQGPSTDASELARIRSALEAGQPVRAELINYTRDGDEYWLELDITALRDEHNHVTHFVAVERDTTARKQMEMALHERVKELNCLYQVSSFSADPRTPVTDVLRKIVNVLPAAMLHSDIAVARIVCEDEDIQSTGWREPVVRTAVKIIQGDTAKGLVEIGYWQQRQALDSRTAFLPEEENMLGVIANHISQMLTNRETTGRLIQAEKLGAVGQLTGGVAHDFNNLLTVILGSTELLKEQIGDNASLHAITDMTTAAALRGVALTQRLLAFARRQALEPQLLDANRLIAGLEGLLRSTMTENIGIEIVRAGGLWTIEADPGQLESALLNLAINARDAMPEGGQLTIETANAALDEDYAAQHNEVRPGQYVMITVSDTGCGMTPDEIAQAFEPFYTTKDVGKGSGLGLSMVYGFVKQSEGHAKIYSELNEGTTVKLYFPRASGAGERPELPSALPEETGGSEHILVVEDDAMVRNVVINLLKRLGYRVSSADSGPAALEFITAHDDIDLLFTDIIMPGGMNGRELAEAACRLRPRMKVLYTSGYTENAIVHHGRLDRGVQLLSKPYRRQELAAKLRKVLDG